MQLTLICDVAEKQQEFERLTSKWSLTHENDSPFALVMTETRLELRKQDEPKLGAVYVDFVDGAVGHRRKFGGGKGQAIAKAVGLNKGVTPRVLDATAGLGRDGFVLASLGCEVQLIERHPVVAALLDDGLQRAYQDAEIGTWMRARMTLLHASSAQALTEMAQTPGLQRPDVVYLDPMYPHKKKAALVKKEMRVFQSLVGADTDADSLLDPALALARSRVVVKRPDYAEPLAGIAPHSSIATKKNRFDMYINAALTVDH
ncbi:MULTISPECIES: class I SAM-dependent methyltransferase [unclassified Salinivibrio]|uniref:class I SAM-dependent methyltransferase n=1 Tax=unclassified Salinivibrio TaxID=2636825 RepID=UPI0009858699|nr:MULTISPECIES: class I SAM-dependent methyltransferase [unclassified Salinivibrio]OOF14843.1 16S rRNA methyltransferase [Salinivibrio sp. PR919]OOF18812.1 16S rRNA methyltransferase [Salinivibrio sp. PR932]